MRNISQEELNEILKEHELWLTGKGGKQADLISANLEFTDLSKANLKHANLIGANLEFTDLRYAKLSRANLRYVDLEFADLSNADLKDVKTNN